MLGRWYTCGRQWHARSTDGWEYVVRKVRTGRRIKWMVERIRNDRQPDPLVGMLYWTADDAKSAALNWEYRLQKESEDNNASNL